MLIFEFLLMISNRLKVENVTATETSFEAVQKTVLL